MSLIAIILLLNLLLIVDLLIQLLRTEVGLLIVVIELLNHILVGVFMCNKFIIESISIKRYSFPGGTSNLRYNYIDTQDFLLLYLFNYLL